MIFDRFRKRKPAPEQPKQAKRGDVFDDARPQDTTLQTWQTAFYNTFQRTALDIKPVDGTAQDGVAMDSGTQPDSLKGAWAMNMMPISEALVSYFGSQSFIGYQLCAMIAQNWLVDKACTIPARDAVRNGWKITLNNGDQLTPEVEDYIRQRDKFYKIKEKAVEFVRFNRIFGIRIAMPVFVGVDDDFYEKPFNPDGIKPGSYKGMNQLDPYWIVPELDNDAAANPGSLWFYEPTYWRISGAGNVNRVHRSHLIIARTGEVADILKPTYFYGGVSIPQKIFERVYAAERTANEAPLLAMTKRTFVRNVDLSKVMGQYGLLEQRLSNQNRMRDNHGTLVIDTDEKVQNLETTLTGLSETINDQYQLVAAVANVPATKLLGTSPKGFNATGEFEAASYREELESTQEHDISPFLERHYLCVSRSDVVRKFPSEKPMEFTVAWEPLDSPTADEQAATRLKESQAALNWSNMGAITGTMEYNRLVADPESGYSAEIPEGLSDGPTIPQTIEAGKADTTKSE